MLWARASDDEEVSRAVMTNPNLPLSLLRAFVTSGFETAWRNPSVPLLLLTDPSPEYEVAARRLLALASLEEGKYVRGNLAQLVAQWAPGPPGRARRLARQFALLFGLPWPSP
ncbi:MAG: hypothetical protein EOO75_04170 [Myxococcales bacterium]|nr:MAG: hypothetical protein EOO75_04170 [Myxococcales bacterium]